MIVTCPHCATHFKVPEGTLGTKGRTMKCARCSHVWRAMPVSMVDDVPLEAPAANPRQNLPMDDVMERMFAEHDMSGDIALSEIESLGISGEGSDRLDEDDEDPFAEMSDLMRARRPESMPDMYEQRVPKPSPRRKGGVILWIVVLIILLAAVASALYYLQDRLIDHWPAFGKYYDWAGMRQEDVGVGLSFRNYNSERLVQDNNEVLIVRGVIANGTEQKKDIPLLRLALYNGANLLQEKIISPPQPSLDARTTVGFKVTLEQPDANATRFEVTFTAPKAPEK